VECTISSLNYKEFQTDFAGVGACDSWIDSIGVILSEAKNLSFLPPSLQILRFTQNDMICDL
jgi:hypothetical protein